MGTTVWADLRAISSRTPIAIALKRVEPLSRYSAFRDRFLTSNIGRVV